MEAFMEVIQIKALLRFFLAVSQYFLYLSSSTCHLMATETPEHHPAVRD